MATLVSSLFIPANARQVHLKGFGIVQVFQIVAQKGQRRLLGHE